MGKGINIDALRISGLIAVMHKHHFVQDLRIFTRMKLDYIWYIAESPYKYRVENIKNAYQNITRGT